MSPSYEFMPFVTVLQGLCKKRSVDDDDESEPTSPQFPLPKPLPDVSLDTVVDEGTIDCDDSDPDHGYTGSSEREIIQPEDDGLGGCLEELHLRTTADLPQEVWNEIHTLRGLRKVSVWSMEGPPRVLQGWSTRIGNSLVELELSVCPPFCQSLCRSRLEASLCI